MLEEKKSSSIEDSVDDVTFSKIIEQTQRRDNIEQQNRRQLNEKYFIICFGKPSDFCAYKYQSFHCLLYHMVVYYKAFRQMILFLQNFYHQAHINRERHIIMKS